MHTLYSINIVHIIGHIHRVDLHIYIFGKPLVQFIRCCTLGSLIKFNEVVALANKQWLNLVILGEDNNDYAALANAIRGLNLNGKAKGTVHKKLYGFAHIYIYMLMTNCRPDKLYACPI